jgi:hypothetical protein
MLDFMADHSTTLFTREDDIEVGQLALTDWRSARKEREMPGSVRGRAGERIRVVLATFRPRAQRKGARAQSYRGRMTA